ncbi:hypothetical protein D3C78_1150560 [compost metagenome]
MAVLLLTPGAADPLTETDGNWLYCCKNGAPTVGVIVTRLLKRTRSPLLLRTYSSLICSARSRHCISFCITT